MLIIRLGPRREVFEDASTFLTRQWVGYSPRMSEEELYDAARGWWRLAPQARRERFALVISPEGTAVMAIAITDWADQEDTNRSAFSGTVLGRGHAVYDRFVNRPNPAPNTSRNPIRYITLPGVSGQYPTCHCGCGTETRKDWVVGHDQRAVHERIAADFNGNISRFIKWYDANGPTGSSDERSGLRSDG